MPNSSSAFVSSAHVADGRAHTRLSRKYFNATVLPAGSTDRMLMDDMLTAGKLVTVGHDAEL